MGIQVAALLLLSQQEERHLLERNVSAALQKKIEELQRNLLQVILNAYILLFSICIAFNKKVFDFGEINVLFLNAF